MPGPFCFAWAGGVIEEQQTIVATGTTAAGSTTVSNIPSSALSNCLPGLIYNIAGNGLVAGSTFMAPAAGATSIVLDTPATASMNALLTITGPRTPNAPWDPAAYGRFDEEVLSIELAQSEGDFATLTIGLKNPGLGLLAAGRNLWCWLSWDQAWTPEGGAAPDLVPLFNGRLIGVPRRQAGEVVELQFVARPDDYLIQKGALAASLQVLPYWDPVWLASSVSADTVLETYSALWHVDRATLALSTSDIIEGEDGTITIGENESLYDNFSLAYGQPPLSAVTVSGTVSWNQQAGGIIDITQTILNGFRDQAGAPYGRELAHKGTVGIDLKGGGLINVLSGDGLLNAWPKAGSAIGAGWSFPNGDGGDGRPLNYCEKVFLGSFAHDEWSYNVEYATSFNDELAAQNVFGGGGDYIPYNDRVMAVLNKGRLVQVQTLFPLETLRFRSVVEYKADRPRTETVAAVMVADVQRQLSDSADQDLETIELTSDYVGQAVDDGALPIGSLVYKSYFQTDRGTQSFEYLLLAARAKLRARARSVDVTFAVPWTTALGIGLKNSVTLLDRRLPDGTCTGKVKSYTLRVADGIMLGEFTLGCTIGNGTPSAAATGQPTYVDEGYVERGWQVYAGSQTVLFEDEFAYQSLEEFAVDDDGVNLSNLSQENAVNYCTVENGMLTQVQELDKFQGVVGPTAEGDPVTKWRQMVTLVTLDLKPLAGMEFHTDFLPALTQLSIPKTIDLGAGTAPRVGPNSDEYLLDAPVGAVSLGQLSDEVAASWRPRAR